MMSLRDDILSETLPGYEAALALERRVGNKSEGNDGKEEISKWWREKKKLHFRVEKENRTVQ